MPTDGTTSSTAPPTLSEQQLVSPPWRRPAGGAPQQQAPPHHYSFVPRSTETRPGAITQNTHLNRINCTVMKALLKLGTTNTQILSDLIDQYPPRCDHPHLRLSKSQNGKSGVPRSDDQQRFQWEHLVDKQRKTNRKNKQPGS